MKKLCSYDHFLRLKPGNIIIVAVTKRIFWIGQCKQAGKHFGGELFVCWDKPGEQQSRESIFSVAHDYPFYNFFLLNKIEAEYFKFFAG